MTANTNGLETRFDEQGSLRPPGPLGRLVRFGFGILTLLPPLSLLPNARAILERSVLPTHQSWWIGVVVGLWVFPYVVNIGLGVNWRGAPRVVAAAVLAGSVGVGYLVTGNSWWPVSGALFFAWMIYTFGHLSISFLLSALIATPGCEMRSMPHLLSKITGRAAREHYCPGVLDPIDKWEAARGAR